MITLHIWKIFILLLDYELIKNSKKLSDIQGYGDWF